MMSETFRNRLRDAMFDGLTYDRSTDYELIVIELGIRVAREVGR